MWQLTAFRNMGTVSPTVLWMWTRRLGWAKTPLHNHSHMQVRIEQEPCSDFWLLSDSWVKTQTVFFPPAGNSFSSIHKGNGPELSDQHCQFKVWPQSLWFQLWGDRHGEEKLWPGELLGSKAGKRLGCSQARGQAWKEQPWVGGWVPSELRLRTPTA